MKKRLYTITMSLLVAACASELRAGDDGPMFDLAKDKVLYCVGYAHLDTQWRWDFCTTIDRSCARPMIRYTAGSPAGLGRSGSAGAPHRWKQACPSGWPRRCWP